MGEFLNGNKIIRKVWNIKNVFKVEGWQKGNITMSNYWDMSSICNSNMLKEMNEGSYGMVFDTRVENQIVLR